MTIKTTFTALAVAGLLTGAPAMAGNTNIDAGGGKGLVVVDLSNIDVATEISNILNDPDIAVQDVINVGSVQVPINVAANVCNLTVNAIASSNDQGVKSCEAETTSEALNQAVLNSINEANS